MAAANTRDGGVIVIGKAESEGKFELVGLTPAQACSFDTTKIANWVNSRCIPPVTVTACRVSCDGKDFVVVWDQRYIDAPVVRFYDDDVDSTGRGAIPPHALSIRPPGD
jgi:hypothetical protein